MIHLNTIFFKPNCEFTPKEEWIEIVSKIAQQPEWIIDANYPNTLLIRAERADTIFLIIPSRFVCYFNLIKRNYRKFFYKEIRSDVSINKCDKFNFSTIKRIWEFKSKIEKYYTEILNMTDKNVYYFKSLKELDSYINQMKINSL